MFLAPSQNSLLLPFLGSTKFYILDGNICIMYGMRHSINIKCLPVKHHDMDKYLPCLYTGLNSRVKSSGVGARSKDYDFVKAVE